MSTLIEKLRNRHKEWSLNTNYWMDDKLILDVFNDVISIVKQHSDWISVDERLPEPKQEVLIDVGGKTRIAIFLGKAEDGDELLFDYDFTEDEKFAYQYFCDTSHQVTHWQPLPRPLSEVRT